MALFNYGVLPSSRLEALGQILDTSGNGHLSAVYQPFDNDTAVVQTQACPSCGAFINGSCRTINKRWICTFCNSHNDLDFEAPIPMSYLANIGKSDSSATRQSILVVDLNCGPEELDAIKNVLKRSFSNVATHLGIITIRSGGVAAFECANGYSREFNCNDSTVSSEALKLNKKYFQKKLELGHSHFWHPVTEAFKIIDGLKPQSMACKGKREERATGLALFLASTLEPKHCHVIAFLQGTCTCGPGKVVPRNMKYHIRQRHELDAAKAKYYPRARNFYQELANLTQKHLDYDIFCGSLDQVGILEFIPLVSHVAQFDSFTDSTFERSFTKYASWYQEEMFPQEIEIITSSNLLVDGCFGNVTKLSPTKSNYSDTPMGVGGTNRWDLSRASILDKHSCSLVISFHVDTAPRKIESIGKIPDAMAVQFVFKFKQNDLQFVKVDTVVLPTMNNESLSAKNPILESFDARVTIVSLMKQIAFDCIVRGKWHTSQIDAWRQKLDKLVVNHCRMDEMLPSSMAILEYVYHLKRSTLLRNANSSPDESVLFQHQILNCGLLECQRMCKPEVLIFDSGNAHVEGNLSQDLLHIPSTMCVDGGNFIVVRYTQSGSQDTTYAYNYALQLIRTRWPHPVFRYTEAGGSQDRFLTSKLIPNRDVNSTNILHTDDASLDDYKSAIWKISGCSRFVE